MNKKQQRAIVAINRAMAMAKRAGLALAGVDDNLMIFSEKQFYRVSEGRGPSEVINELDAEFIDAPYIDSGGT